MKIVLSLADLEARGVARLTIVYDRCPRRGVYGVARLIQQHGRDLDLVRLRLLLAADCPTHHTGLTTPLCGVRYPALPSLFLT